MVAEKDLQTEDDQYNSSLASGSNTTNESMDEREKTLRSLCEKINKFLEEKESDGSRNTFVKGVALSPDDIDKAISLVGKDKAIFDQNPSYRLFLEKYGCVYGGNNFNISGPICSVTTDIEKVRYITTIQSDFSEDCKEGEHRIATDPKYLWLVAERSEGVYYMDSSPKGKGRIYLIGDYCKPKRFAKDFLEFLDNFFELYQEENEEESSEEETTKQ